MFAVPILYLLVAAHGVEIRRPNLKHLSSGDIHLSVGDVPGLTALVAKLHFPGVTYKAKFEQGADGWWYHRNPEANYNGKDKIKYTVIGTLNEKTVISKGTLYSEENSLALLPPKRVRRGTMVFRDDFNGAFNPAGWNYENWEIQAYVSEARNVFTRNGHLFIKPTLTTDHPDFNEGTLHTGVMDLKGGALKPFLKILNAH